MPTAKADARFLRIAPRKVRLVADLIRGKSVAEARAILAYTVKGAAPELSKLLKSAVSNAESVATEKHERIDTDEMLVKQILVDGAGRLPYRSVQGPRGRAMRIRKKFSHVKLLIGDE